MLGDIGFGLGLHQWRVGTVSVNVAKGLKVTVGLWISDVGATVSHGTRIVVVRTANAFGGWHHVQPEIVLC